MVHESFETRPNRRKVLDSPNFVSLLNLGDTIRRYGPPGIWWEGDQKAEGFMKVIKLFFTGMFLNWAYLLVVRIYQHCAMEHILGALSRGQRHSDMMPMDDVGSPPLNTTSFFRYPSSDSLTKDLESGQVISGWIVDDRDMYCAIKTGERGKFNAAPITFNDSRETGVYVEGMQIYFAPAKAGCPKHLSEISPYTKVDYFVLLPQFDQEGNPLIFDGIGPKYYCITSTWRERHPGGWFDYQCSI